MKNPTHKHRYIFLTVRLIYSYINANNTGLILLSENFQCSPGRVREKNKLWVKVLFVLMPIFQVYLFYINFNGGYGINILLILQFN